jgi:phosphatidate phosphatase APP1
MPWSRYLAHTVHQLERGIDSVRYRLSERFSKDEVVPFPYLTYGNEDRLLVRGRVLQARAIEPAREDASLWENLKNAYRRFESDEAPFAEVELGFGDLRARVVADEEGYFEQWLDLPEPLPADRDVLQHVDVALLSPLRDGQGVARSRATVVVPDRCAEFGTISDVDDTVLRSGATNVLRMASKVLFGNARTRLPFEGVGALYRALHRDVNPIFYVSSSPWNLYDVLVEFFDIHGIPLGPIVLRDWGIRATELLPTSHGSHKLDAIASILTTYPQLPFLLIGDSGQEDPEIYTEVVRRFGEQIVGIYIRDVTGRTERSDEIEALAAEVARTGQEQRLVPDTVTAARHAVEQGRISEGALVEIAEAKLADEGRDGD